MTPRVAQRRSAARPAPRRPGSAAPRRGGNGMPGWVWLLVGAAITLFVVVVVHLAQPRRGVPKPAATPLQPAPAPARTAPVPVPPKQPSRFSFYEMLPSHEVVIPSAEAEKAVKARKGGKPLPAELAAPGAYVVQVGAYRSRAEAERARASVALLGVEAHTEQVTLDAGDIWYRVRIGPEDSLDKAQAVVDRLQSNNVKAILIKQKG